MSSIDSATNNDFLMISKAIVPYLDTDKQKAVAVFIKAFELMSTIDLFSSEEFVKSIAKPRDVGWEKSFLSDVRTNLSDDRAHFVDAILKLSEVKDLFSPKNTDNVMSSFQSDLNSNTATPFIPSQPASSSTTLPHDSPHTSNNAGQILDKLSGILEPNQLQILKMLSAFMK